MCDEYGADTLRLYEMSMGPLDVSRPWDTRAVVGSYRFLQRLWRNVVDEDTGEVARRRRAGPTRRRCAALHKTIDGVRGDMDGPALQHRHRQAHRAEQPPDQGCARRTPREVAEPLVLMLAPLAPHIAEELWRRLGHDRLAGLRAASRSPTRRTSWTSP